MVFVDHASNFTYIHLNEALMTVESLDAKHEFERIVEQHGVKIHHYHYDNGHFADCTFVANFCKAQQTIMFCGVGAHHQTALQNDAFAMLLKAPEQYCSMWHIIGQKQSWLIYGLKP